MELPNNSVADEPNSTMLRDENIQNKDGSTSNQKPHKKRKSGKRKIEIGELAEYMDPELFGSKEEENEEEQVSLYKRAKQTKHQQLDVPQSPTSRVHLGFDTAAMFPAALVPDEILASDSDDSWSGDYSDEELEVILTKKKSQETITNESKEAESKEESSDNESQDYDTICIVGPLKEPIWISRKKFIEKCPFFDSLFVGAGSQMKEGKSDHFEFPEDDPILFKMMSDYAMKGFLQTSAVVDSTNLSNDLELLTELYLMANQYTFDDLEAYCLDLITPLINEKNFNDVLGVAQQTQAPLLLKRLQAFCLDPANEDMVRNADHHRVFGIFDDSQNNVHPQYLLLCKNIPTLLSIFVNPLEISFLHKLVERKGIEYLKGFVTESQLSESIKLSLLVSWIRLDIIDRRDNILKLKFHCIPKFLLQKYLDIISDSHDVNGLLLPVNLSRYSTETPIKLDDAVSQCSGKSKIRTVLLTWLWHVLSECTGRIKHRFIIWFRAVCIFDRFLERKTSYQAGKDQTVLKHLQLTAMLCVKLAVNSSNSGKISKAFCNYYTDDAHSPAEVEELYSELRATVKAWNIDPSENTIEYIQNAPDIPHYFVPPTDDENANTIANKEICDITVSILAFAMLDWSMIGRPVSVVGEAACVTARMIYYNSVRIPLQNHAAHLSAIAEVAPFLENIFQSLTSDVRECVIELLPILMLTAPNNLNQHLVARNSEEFEEYEVFWEEFEIASRHRRNIQHTFTYVDERTGVAHRVNLMF